MGERIHPPDDQPIARRRTVTHHLTMLGQAIKSGDRFSGAKT
jgi:hypothetical protein